MATITDAKKRIDLLKKCSTKASITPDYLGGVLTELANAAENEIRTERGHIEDLKNNVQKIESVAIGAVANISMERNGEELSFTVERSDDDYTLHFPIASITQSGIISTAKMKELKECRDQILVLKNSIPKLQKKYNELARYVAELGVRTLGVYTNRAAVENAAKEISVCADVDNIVLRFMVGVGASKENGFFLQNVSGDKCVQYMYFDCRRVARVITFTSPERTAVKTVTAWNEADIPIGVKVDSTSAKFKNVSNQPYGENIPIATQTQVGMMSTLDKKKLDELQATIVDLTNRMSVLENAH